MAVQFKRTVAIVMGILCLITIVKPLYSQKNNNYSLSTLVDSLKHSLPVLLQKQTLINSAKEEITDARHSFLPSLLVGDEVSIASSNNYPGSFLPLVTIPSIGGSIRADNNLQPATGNTFSLYSQYELADFGYKRAKIKNAEAFAGLQQADYDKALYLLELQLSRVYFSVIRNRFQLGIDEQNIRRSESVYTIIKGLAESGLKAGVDSSMARAELSKARISYNQREGAINQLLQQVSYLTGVPVSNINIDTTQNLAAIHSNVPFVYKEATDNPLLSCYTSEQLLNKATEDLVRKSYLPKVMLGLSGWGRGSSIKYNDQYQSLATGLGYQRFNYTAGVAITYDLFNGVHKKDKLTESHFQTKASEYAKQQQQLWLQNETLQADQSIKIADKNLVELPYQLQAAKETYDQKLSQYKAGLVNLVDLNTASLQLYIAQTSYVETLTDWLVANLEKSAASGNLDLFIQTIK